MQLRRKGMRFCAAVLVFFLLFGVRALDAQTRYETSEVIILGDSGLARLNVELALTDAQQQLGLQERDSLRAGWGMLFRLSGQLPAGMPAVTMYRTRMPLDIAFLDREGTIVDIVSMMPCA